RQSDASNCMFGNCHNSAPTPLPSSLMLNSTLSLFPFFFNATATTQIYTLSLHDALPISGFSQEIPQMPVDWVTCDTRASAAQDQDRKSTRLNSSHRTSSYAVFCLKKKRKE